VKYLEMTDEDRRRQEQRRAERPVVGRRARTAVAAAGVLTAVVLGWGTAVGVGLTTAGHVPDAGLAPAPSGETAAGSPPDSHAAIESRVAVETPTDSGDAKPPVEPVEPSEVADSRAASRAASAARCARRWAIRTDLSKCLAGLSSTANRGRSAARSECRGLAD